MSAPSSASSASSRASPSLEVAHVLFMDIPGYSLLSMNDQNDVVGELQEVVTGVPAFQRAHADATLISLPSGDGMALVFFGDPSGPVECARQISRAMQSHPRLNLRMGIHSGPVYRVCDVNANMNVAGGGINLAQRVMDAADSGHILISKTCAD